VAVPAVLVTMRRLNSTPRYDALDKLEAFASKYGADFYSLPYNCETILLKRDPWELPATIPYDGSQLVPLGASTTLNWKLSL